MQVGGIFLTPLGIFCGILAVVIAVVCHRASTPAFSSWGFFSLFLLLLLGLDVFEVY